MKKSKPNPHKNTNTVRLNKFISSTGVASRRKADDYIRFGHVRINGKTIRELGYQVNPQTDTVVVKNKPIKPPQDLVYLMFNKPTKVITTMNDPEGRPTINDFLTKARIKVFPVGRLDWDTEGLLLLTNDGTFAQQISHPKNEIAKTYIAKLSGQPTGEQIQKLLHGVSIIGGKVKALHVSKVTTRGTDKYDWYKIIINEGKNRQIRLMFQKIGFDVKKLQRVAIGSLKLGGLERGQFLIMGPRELQKIFEPPRELRLKDENKVERRRQVSMKKNVGRRD